MVIPYGPEGRNEGRPTRMTYTRRLGPMGQARSWYWTGAMRTSENPIQANFGERPFYEVG